MSQGRKLGEDNTVRELIDDRIQLLQTSEKNPCILYMLQNRSEHTDVQKQCPLLERMQGWARDGSWGSHLPYFIPDVEQVWLNEVSLRQAMFPRSSVSLQQQGRTQHMYCEGKNIAYSNYLGNSKGYINSFINPWIIGKIPNSRDLVT